MYNKLKDIAEVNNWIFKYARRDYQNLVNEVDNDNIFLFLDPVQTANEFDEYNNPVAVNYSGSFLLLKASDFDQDYEGRYVEHIKPLIDSTLKQITESIACDEKLNIQSWNTTEIINLFDMNLDGIAVKYTVIDV
jgi:hypothetical protein